MDFAVNAAIHCTDGAYGSLSAMVADPKTEKLTYIVAKQRKKPHTEYLVPLSRVKETTATAIHLDCTIAEVEEYQRYRTTEYIHVADLHTAGDPLKGSPFYTPQTKYATTARPNVPSGQRSINPGLKVKATDGEVGHVGRLVVDPESEKITHFVLEKGHATGPSHVVIPVSEIDSRDDKTVILKLDKATIASLPGFQLDHKYAKEDISVMDLNLILATFDSEDKAAEVAKSLRKEVDNGNLEVLNAAGLSKNDKGKTTVKEMADVSPKKGRFMGAVTGGVIGLLGGPVGLVVGAAAGAATGGVAANKIDRGFANKYLAKVEEELSAGNSALVILAQGENANKLVKALTEAGGEVTQQSLTDSVVSELAAAHSNE